MSTTPQPFTLSVNGMTCVNCARGIEKKLISLGATSASVNFSDHKVHLEADPHIIEKLIKGVRDLGYAVSTDGSKIEHAWWQTTEAKVIASGLFTLPLLLHMVLPFHLLHDPIFQLALSTPVVLIGIQHFGKSALGSLKAAMPNMDLLIMIGVLASFIYSCLGLYLGRPEDFLFFETAASIVTYVLIGNLIERRSVKKTTSAIEELGALQPLRAKRINRDTGAVEEIPIGEIHSGDTVLVATGDQVPTDGKILSGDCLINEAMLTGESLEVEKSVDDQVFGGTILTKGSITMQTTAIGSGTVLAGIIRLVSEAQAHKPNIQRVGDAVSAVFVPAVLILALGTFFISISVVGTTFQEALIRSIAVLVVACPCAMGLATPTAIMVGVGRAAKMGILIRGGDTLERFAKIQSVIFDKTGTVTTGRFGVEKLSVREGTEEEIQGIIYALEERSSHPIAQSLRAAFSSAPKIALKNIREEKGLSIQGQDTAGITYELGSKKIAPSETSDEFDLYLLKNGKVAAALAITDEIKGEARDVIAEFKDNKIYTALLSGDSERKCKAVQERINFHEYMSERSPDEKLREIGRMEQMAHTAYVGDGVNDAPALTRAFVGVSMSEASASAINAARVVLLHGNLNKLFGAWRISRLTLRTIKQNLFWAFFYNILMIPLAASGYLSPGIAALSMALSDVFVIGNSLRLRFLKL